MQVDRDLVEAARRGDREAYADLIRVRGDWLFAVAQRILRDVDRTEDAVQDALVIAWRDLPGLRDPDRFDAWLRRLLVRSCVFEAKRERRLGATVRFLPIDIDIPSRSDDYLTVADRDELDRGFRRLSPEQRALLVLRHFAGLETAEIADALAIPPGTVRSRLHHAHRAMRAALDADARAIAIEERPA
jgi:RNA polymerase sigma-70 factor, ECF subfamily